MIAQWHDLFHKVTEGPGVLVERTGGIALIRAVKQHLTYRSHFMRKIGCKFWGETHHQPARANGVANGDPLLARGVKAGGIVGAGVKHLKRQGFRVSVDRGLGCWLRGENWR